MRDRTHSTRLRVERSARGETLASVRQRTGISVGRLSMIERGFAKPSPDEQQRLAAAFGMPIDELFPPSERRRRK
jgi:transcriptional regulator with XRE-family HTH domain